jgi:hypothetical protein
MSYAMSARRLPIETDGATARLIAFARGVSATGLLPKASADLLVRLARGLRLMCEAREAGLAWWCWTTSTGWRRTAGTRPRRSATGSRTTRRLSGRRCGEKGRRVRSDLQAALEHPAGPPSARRPRW